MEWGFKVWMSLFVEKRSDGVWQSMSQICWVQMGPMPAQVSLRLKFCSQSALTAEWTYLEMTRFLLSRGHLAQLIFVQHEKQHRPMSKLPLWQSIALNMHPSFGFWLHLCSQNGTVSHQCVHYNALCSLSLTWHPQGESASLCQELIPEKHDTLQSYCSVHVFSVWQ